MVVSDIDDQANVILTEIAKGRHDLVSLHGGVCIMDKIGFSVSCVTGGLLIFTILCSPIVSVPVSLLLLFLFSLQVGLVWMVFTILKNGKPPAETFDEKFYEDQTF